MPARFERLLTVSAIAAACWLFACTPHELKGRTVAGKEYTVPHAIIREVPKGDKGGHTQIAELSDEVKRLYEKFWDDKIKEAGFTTEQIKRTSPATAEYDCHGLTFDDGESFIDSAYAEDVARYYGYKPISQCLPSSDPKEGDIVVYRKNGTVTHSGRVIGKRGTIVRVHSKWGRSPNFEHDVDVVPAEYGKAEIWRKCP